MRSDIHVDSPHGHKSGHQYATATLKQQFGKRPIRFLHYWCRRSGASRKAGWLMSKSKCEMAFNSMITAVQFEESKMKIRCIRVLSLFSCLAIFGCSSEQQSVAPSVQQAVVSPAEREKIRLLVKELQAVAGLSDKTFAILGQEAKALVTGEKKSVDLVALVDKTKNELLAAGTDMATKSLPEGLPPGIKQNLQEAKDGLIKAGQLKGESLEVMSGLLKRRGRAFCWNVAAWCRLRQNRLKKRR